MKNILGYFFFLTFLTVLSCKKGQIDLNHTLNKDSDLKNLNYHLANGLRDIDNRVGVEQKFNAEVYLRQFAFYEKDDNEYNLILELQDDIAEEIVSKYTFAVEGFVVGDELSNLSDYAKRKNRLHDAWFGTPKLTKVNKRCYVILHVETKLKHFNLVKFFLYDKDGYKGDIGSRIIVRNYDID